MDRKAYFLFAGDVNAYFEECLWLSTTNLHCKAARDFVSSSVCERMVRESTHIDGGIHDLVLTDVPVPVVVGDYQFIEPFLGMVCWSNLYLTLCAGNRLSQKLCGQGTGERRCEECQLIWNH